MDPFIWKHLKELSSTRYFTGSASWEKELQPLPGWKENKTQQLPTLSNAVLPVKKGKRLSHRCTKHSAVPENQSGERWGVRAGLVRLSKALPHSIAHYSPGLKRIPPLSFPARTVTERREAWEGLCSLLQDLCWAPPKYWQCPWPKKLRRAHFRPSSSRQMFLWHFGPWGHAEAYSSTHYFPMEVKTSM